MVLWHHHRLGMRLVLLGVVLFPGLGCGPLTSIDRAESVDGAAEEAGGQSGAGGGGGSGGEMEGQGGQGGQGGAGGTGNGAGGSGNGAGGGGGTNGEGQGGSSPSDDAGLPVDSAPIDLAAAEVPVTPAQSVLEVSHNGGAFGANLTALGTLDWMHFGLGGNGNVNRKRNVAALISMKLLGASNVGHYDDRPIVHTWSDGTPIRSATDVPDGIVVGDVVGRGFEIRVPGAPDQRRTVKVYVGAWGARARLTAELSDDSAPAYSDRSLSVQNPGGDLVYSISFQPSSADQALVVRWTLDTINREFGNVTLQAVTVSQ